MNLHRIEVWSAPLWTRDGQRDTRRPGPCRPRWCIYPPSLSDHLPRRLDMLHVRACFCGSKEHEPDVKVGTCNIFYLSVAPSLSSSLYILSFLAFAALQSLVEFFPQPAQ